MKSVLFIHRSVGRNLINDGGMYHLASTISPNFALNDYDQNVDLLHDNVSMPRKMGFTFPGRDTRPADYAAIFSESPDPAYQPILDFALGYDVVVIKSCYTSSNITSDDELNAMEQAYQSIAKFFSTRPDKRLVILTSPPLRHFKTSKAAAARARLLATWLATQSFGPNIFVFNFFDLLANPEGSTNPHTLYAKYCRLWPFDSHPNAAASQAIAPLLVEFIAGKLG